MRLRIYLPIIGFVALVLVSWIGLLNIDRNLPSPLVGKAAPITTLPDLFEEGTLHRSEAMLGQPYLLNVWASWCRACLEEHEMLKTIAQSERIKMIGLNYRDDQSDAQQWLQRYGNPFENIWFDELGRASIDWGVYGAPETFIVDAQGVIRFKHVGPIDMQLWQERLLPLIEELS